MPPSGNPTRRFSDRVEYYVRYRPSYPPDVLRILRDETGLTPAHVIADIGSGTGISTALFLANGNTVYAVEPNREMRRAAEERLGSDPQFHSVEGTAEDTTLVSRSVDYVVAGQAFHWFDARRARREVVRILRPGRWDALMWNARKTDITPFLRDYEALLEEFGTDYREVDHTNLSAASFEAFFGPSGYQRRTAPNVQILDFDGLRGRLLSSSYAPLEGDPRHVPMLESLARIFAAHQQNGRIAFHYETEIYFGRVDTIRVKEEPLSS